MSVCICACTCVPATISTHLIVRFCRSKQKEPVCYKAEKQEIRKKEKILLSMKSRFKVKDDYIYSKLQPLLLLSGELISLGVTCGINA